MRPRVLWRPSAAAMTGTDMGRFATECSQRSGLDLDDYDKLWRWSVTDLAGFWSSVVDQFEVELGGDTDTVLTGDSMLNTRWFPGATVNYAQHALTDRFPDGALAIISESQMWGHAQLTRGELRRKVAQFQDSLRGLGLGRGDAVAAYLPNIPETIIAFLACAGLGIKWSSCAPEFGVKAVVDRLGQFQPKL
ncbi:MAG: AMP-binding protein, partial [Microthrixaceae bacterium]|nr:AMP-binding protein [Microthrixaceae bacterium]